MTNRPTRSPEDLARMIQGLSPERAAKVEDLVERLHAQQEGELATSAATASFGRYVGIDYSGAGTPTSSLKGLRICLATPDAEPAEVGPPPGRKHYWTRRGIAEWLDEQLAESTPTLVGIDHGFSFPLRYFESHGIEPDWDLFLEDFHAHWPTDEDDTYVQFVRDGVVGNGAARTGDSRWKRLTEERAPGTKSVFQFDMQGSVAKSTHSGLPWLRHLRRELGAQVHFWPFDGWSTPPGLSVVAEVYPSLWRQQFPRDEGLTGDQQDAYAVAAWLRRADLDGSLERWLEPALTLNERRIAEVEGWILGVP